MSALTAAAIFTALRETGIPTAYQAFPDPPGQRAPAPPFVLFAFPENDDFYADGKNYAPVSLLQVELYTAVRDLESEAAVEAALRSLGRAFSRSTDNLPKEKLCVTTYETEVLIRDGNEPQ